MERYLDILRNSAQKAIDQVKEVLEDKHLNTFLDDFASIKNAQNLLTKNIETLRSKVKSFMTPIKIEVPYDRDTETLSYTINGRTISIRIKSFDNEECKHEYTLTKTLQNEIDADTVVQHYDKEKHLMVFHFKPLIGFTNEEGGNDIQNEENNDIEETPINAEETSQDDEEVPTEVPTLEEDRLAIAKSLREQGWSYRRIGKEIGVSDKTVARWLRNH